MKASFERRLERDPQEVAISVMGSGAYRSLSMSRSEAESVLRLEIEEHVRSRAAGAAMQLAARSDLTLTFADLASRWDRCERESVRPISFLAARRRCAGACSW